MLIFKAIKFDTIDWEHQFTNKEYKALVAQKGAEIKERKCLSSSLVGECNWDLAILRPVVI